MPELIADTRHHVKRSSSEQDRAAGGREARLIEIDGGSVARASIELKQHSSENDTYWAYLRWSVGGRTATRYLGRTSGKSRIQCLSKAWELARAKGYGSNSDTRNFGETPMPPSSLYCLSTRR